MRFRIYMQATIFFKEYLTLYMCEYCVIINNNEFIKTRAWGYNLAEEITLFAKKRVFEREFNILSISLFSKRVFNSHGCACVTLLKFNSLSSSSASNRVCIHFFDQHNIAQHRISSYMLLFHRKEIYWFLCVHNPKLS